MFDLARLRGTALALASVALGLGISAARCGGRPTSGRGWFPSMPSKMDVGLLERIGGRWALAARDIGRLRGRRPVSVILGSPTMQTGAQPGH